MSATHLDTPDRGWEHRKQGIPAEEVEQIPDTVSVWACLERTTGRPTTVTAYAPDGDGDIYVTVFDGDCPVYVAFDSFATKAAAAEYVRRLLDHYSTDDTDEE